MTKQKNTLFTSWMVPVLFLLLSLALYWPFVCGGKTLFWGTPLLQFWPWRRFAAEQLHTGQIPLWNPYAGNGTPLLADLQSAIFYPPNLIFWVLPVERAMGLSLVIHAILAGGAMVALAKDLGLTRFAGLIAALAFMFSGYMVARGPFLTEISALPWLPLIWLYTRRLMRRRRLRDLVFLSLAIALQFLAGHAQTWFYCMWTMGLYGVWQGWKWWKSASGGNQQIGKSANGGNRQIGEIGKWAKGKEAKKACRGLRSAICDLRFAICPLSLLVAVVWGIALAAVQFLPTLELSQVAGRASRGDWETFSLQYSFWPWRVLTLLSPDFFGNPAQGNYWGYATYWEDAGYIGLFPFILAVLAVNVWFKKRRQPDLPPFLRETPFWALLALLALLLAMGKNTPLYMFLYRYVPGFRSFQAPARLLCVYTPALALLAGIGADALAPLRSFEKRCTRWLVGGLGILLAAGGAYFALPGVEVTFITAVARMSIWLVLSFLLLIWRNRLWPGHLRHPYWQLAVVLFVAADLIVAGYALNPAIDASLYASQTGIGAFLAADGPQGRTFYFADSRQEMMFDQYLDFADYGAADVEYWWEMREALLPDLGMVEHLPSANSFEPLVEERYYTLLQKVEDMPRQTALRTLGMMNVAYILDPATDLGDEIIYRSPAVNVYRNPYLLPRAYVVHQAGVVAGPDEALAALAAHDFDPAQQVILERPFDRHLSVGQSLATDLRSVTLLPSLSNQVKIRAVLPQPGYLVLADTFYPGWQAFVDGQPVEILRANYAFRAVVLEAGEHKVHFVYRPRSFTIGWICSTIALVAVAAAISKSLK